MFERICKKLLMSFALLSASAFAQDSTAPKFQIIAAPTLQFDSSEIYSIFYANGVFKINDRWSVIPEIRQDLFFKTGGVNKTSFAHQYLRVGIADTKLAEFDGWKLSMLYRYDLPTSDAQQKAGQMGTIVVRPKIGTKFFDGVLSLDLQDGNYLYLNRNYHQVNTDTVAALATGAVSAKGNKFYRNVLEIMPSVELPVKGLSLYFNFRLDFYISGASAGSSGTTSDLFMEHEHGIAYELPFVSGLALNLGFDNRTQLDDGAFQFWSKAESDVYLAVDYKF